jgi:hypothetical protein
MLAVMPLVWSVRVTSRNSTVMGGLHAGWKLAVTDSVPSALPFWRGVERAASPSRFDFTRRDFSHTGWNAARPSLPCYGAGSARLSTTRPERC